MQQEQIQATAVAVKHLRLIKERNQGAHVALDMSARRGTIS